jgi:hypothetical protein
MKKWKLVVAAALALVAVTTAGRGGAGDKDEVGRLMRKKLESSQKVLEGVAVNDFDKIADNAEALIALSKEAQWKAVSTPQYELYSNDFRRTADALSKHAKEKNLDAATLDYVELTLTCVRCHKHVRDARQNPR